MLLDAIMFWHFCFTYYTLIHRDSITGLIYVSVDDTVEIRCVFDQIVQYCYSTATLYKVNLRNGELAPSRFSESNHPSMSNDKTCFFSLKKATLKDSGFYYCTSHQNSVVIIGNGTKMIVTEQISIKPELSILYSPQETNKSLMPLQCVVIGVVPSQVRVYWIIGQKEHTGWTESAWTNSTDSATEFTRAHITLPAAEWARGDEIQCVVEYNGKNISETLKRCESEHLCPWLLYGSFVAAILTMVVTAVFFVCLYREKHGKKMSKEFSRKDAPRKILNYGQQSTLRAESLTVTCSSVDPCLSVEQMVNQSKE
ncbi:uncharacterized protein LOC127650345 isoform X2 [Xyrauchen texanus]|uniref:uncharacterized protein LOC127650345 isoform X2 n=1 Tax=Xyrauchen texanus TaxID=154827 RepID=UPI002242862B|nr:uncharacterized protein LOC127650345 isoform X2 [Xyrauchen texanus]